MTTPTPPGSTPATPTARTPSVPPGTSMPMASGSGRLRQGELRRRVAAHLATTPDAHTPGAIARALGRSAGAVGNALDTLVEHGHAEQVTSHPRRYRRTATTASAATTTAPSPPRHPRTAAPSSTGSASAGSPAPQGGPPPAPSAPGAVRRPNGQAYHPRLLAELPDVTALRRLRDAQIPVLLYGPPGTGKTSLVEAAFDDLITVAGDGDTTVADFVGEYTQASGGGYEFVYGPLVTAMNQGRALFIDDATLISPKVLAVVYPAMDGRRQIIVKAHTGETISAKPGFYVIAGHNPGVHGAVLTDALASRFSAQIQVSTDYDLAVTLKIDPRAIRVARNLAHRQRNEEIAWSPQLRELIAFQKISGVLGTDAAVANLLGIAPAEDRDVVAEVISAVYGRTISPLALGRQL